jgi:hypothetical protein
MTNFRFEQPDVVWEFRSKQNFVFPVLRNDPFKSEEEEEKGTEGERMKEQKDKKEEEGGRRIEDENWEREWNAKEKDGREKSRANKEPKDKTSSLCFWSERVNYFYLVQICTDGDSV